MEYYPRLRDLREDKDLSQETVAKIIDTDQSYYAKYESGKRPIPFERVIKLAKFYGVSLDYIAGLTNNKGGISCDNKESYKFKQKHSGSGNNVINFNSKNKGE